MKYVSALAFVLALAFGQAAQGQGNPIPSPNRVVDQSAVQVVSYDLGIATAETVVEGDEAEVQTAPEGKADTLVVYSGGSWCRACLIQKPIIEALKLQGYKIEYYNIDKDRGKLKYKQVKNSKELDEWNVVPTLFYVRDGEVIKKDEGWKTAVHIRKTLWKPDSKTAEKVVNKVKEVTDKTKVKIEKVRVKFPWNK